MIGGGGGSTEGFEDHSGQLGPPDSKNIIITQLIQNIINNNAEGGPTIPSSTKSRSRDRSRQYNTLNMSHQY